MKRGMRLQCLQNALSLYLIRPPLTSSSGSSLASTLRASFLKALMAEKFRSRLTTASGTGISAAAALDGDLEEIQGWDRRSEMRALSWGSFPARHQDEGSAWMGVDMILLSLS